MKKMSCKQLGGACDTEFQASTFDEMAQLSRAHAMEMVQKDDQAHLDAMNNMKEMMGNQEKMKNWMAEKIAMFNALPDV